MQKCVSDIKVACDRSAQKLIQLRFVKCLL